MMTHQETTQSPHVGAIPTLADIVFAGKTRAPLLYLSFDGSAPPREILAELAALGWSVPGLPTPPSNAIAWVPDPATGNDYTITSWKVEEFCVSGSESWTKHTREDVGRRTVRCLQGHSVQITGIRGHQQHETDEQVATTVITPAGTLIVVQPLRADWIWPDGFTSAVAMRGGAPIEKWMWLQGTNVDRASEIALRSEAARSYQLLEDLRAPDVRGRSTLLALSAGGALPPQGEALFESMLASPVASTVLHSIDGGGDATLYSASVATQVVSTTKAGINATLDTLLVHVV